MALYNIIGDIHGRDCWKNLVREDCVNIFVGDYFSPYHGNSFDSLLENFMDIVKYKTEHPETILLIGNHDEDHWHINEQYSRYDAFHFDDIKNAFESCKDLFQMAYSIENKALVTHAGVSILWYEKWKNGNNKTGIINLDPSEDINTDLQEYVSINGPKFVYFVSWRNKMYKYVNNTITEFIVCPDELEKFINDLWLNGNYKAFNFDNNADLYDSYGESYTHGPIWIRPNSLVDTNIFKYTNYYQFVGHSMFKHPSRIMNNSHIEFVNEIPLSEHEEDKIVWCDCLEDNTESVIFDTDNFLVKINKEKIN